MGQRIKTIAAQLRREVEATMENGQSCGCARRPRHALRSSKWKKVCGPSCRVEGIEPTNNGPERALRHAVIWHGSVAGRTVAMAAGLWSGC